jgi:hypothetical protein
MGLNTFEKVAEWWAKTPVIRSKFGKEHDIRPLNRWCGWHVVVGDAL